MGYTDEPEKDISSAFNYPSKFVMIRDTRLHYVEKGSGHPILFLHGIPANLYLWRNVIPELSGSYRAIALDLAGYGKSDVPANGDYDANNQFTYLEGFIEHMGLQNITLVVTDLGSVLGLNYAARNPQNINGLVIFEGVMMPAYEWYEQLSAMQKIMFALFRNKRVAKSVMLDGTRIQNYIVPMMTLRTLSTAEKLAYTRPYDTNLSKRRVILEGPGPVNFPEKAFLKPETAVRESVIMMNENARRLSGTKIPVLILYAKPGVILNEKARAYATTHYPNVTIQYLGKGKHFLPEEHPKKMGQFIKNWLDRVINSEPKPLNKK